MRVFTNNQYDKMARCILAYPCGLNKENNLSAISKQYNTLINTLIENGIKPCFFDFNGSDSQLFARDIGFVINDLLFISNMKDSARKPEVLLLKEFAQNNNMKHYIMNNTAEGGDIIVHNNKIFIGQGERTNEDAFIEIGNVLRDNQLNYELIKVFFDNSKIHLDCVFNIIDKDTSIISKDIFNIDDVVKHFSNNIRAEAEDLNLLAPNVINIGSAVLCSSEKFSNVLKEQGFNTVFIQFDEIIKYNGSLGCCVLPMVKYPNKIDAS